MIEEEKERRRQPSSYWSIHSQLYYSHVPPDLIRLCHRMSNAKIIHIGLISHKNKKMIYLDRLNMIYRVMYILGSSNCDRVTFDMNIFLFTVIPCGGMLRHRKIDRRLKQICFLHLLIVYKLHFIIFHYLPGYIIPAKFLCLS